MNQPGKSPSEVDGKAPLPGAASNPDQAAEAIVQLIDGLAEWQRKAKARKEAEAIEEAHARKEQLRIQQGRAAKARSAPVFGQDACVCPRCDVFAQHSWHPVEYDPTWKATGNSANLLIQKPANPRAPIPVQGAFFQLCSHCRQLSLWSQEELIRPLPNPPGPPPLDEAPRAVRDLHLEARAICQASPRGAAALLRLALDKLLVELGYSSGGLADRLKEARDGGTLSPQIYDAALAVKLLGDNGVHPGEIDLHELPTSAASMMEFLNLVVEETIIRERRIAAVLKQGSDAKAAASRARPQERKAPAE